ncbi:molybdenum cofactor sulfurase [Dorcoceras hygrometricum]|uniref:Molybdenum cofactor sulfurase n=1 Tax=Dorcoceras hygrometricum TaxID=472368 RepID=A0A2Z7D8H5_9LAMI|nr:molybdenum cofactor sulfurase [Dorcoceras hygrometricum]
MQSNCIGEASRTCFNTCCVNPLLGLPDPHSSPLSTAAKTRTDFATAILSSIQPTTFFTNHETLPSLTESVACLQNALPQYLNTALADEIRAQEYRHLSLSNHVCLDYVGQGLFSYSQLQDCNPAAEIASSSSSVAVSPSQVDMEVPFFDISYKSVNLSSCLLHGCQDSEFEARTRKRILRYMNVLEEDYTLVFTANQSSAFRLLADSYPFMSNQNLLTVYDYENEAVEAIIESARRKGARTLSAVFSWPSFRVNSKKLRKIIVNKNKPKNRGLFVFPLQSRVTGSQYSYQWMNLARENGWHVLLDACALSAKEMETLGLSLFHPDFLIGSFFKIFGENPSGFCSLIVKKSSISDLTQSSTSMGIVSLIPAKGPLQKTAFDQIIHQTPSHKDRDQESQANGTKSKQKQPLISEIIELDKKDDSSGDPGIEFRGLDHADKLGLVLISRRNRCLTNWLVNALLSLRHPHSGNGIPLIRIFGPKIKLNRGAAIAFNVYDWKGERVDPILVQKLADRNKISVSCAFLKNVLLSENSQEEKEKILEKSKNGKGDYGIGVASISIGLPTNFEDVYRLWSFISRFLDADFVEKERWRYTALNQTTVEV